MSLTIGTPVFEPTAPTKTGQIVITGNSDAQTSVYKGYVAITLDSSTTTASINWIDGTQTLAFAPTVVLATANYVSGTPAAISITPYTITSTGFSVKLGAAGAASDVINIAFTALK